MKIYIDWEEQYAYTEKELKEKAKEEVQGYLDYGNLDELESCYDFNCSQILCEVMKGDKTIQEVYDDILQQIIDQKTYDMYCREIED